MIGIDEMFAEFAWAECDEFALWFAIEQTAERTLASKRARERLRYRKVMTLPAYQAERERRREYVRKKVSAHAKRKRATDPQWVEKRRKANREAMARLRERQKQAEMARAA